MHLRTTFKTSFLCQILSSSSWTRRPSSSSARERARAAIAAKEAERQPLVNNGLIAKPSSVLTDTFGRRHTYLRISLSERCNLRCQYCMPEEGVDLTPKDDLLTTDETLKLAELFVKHGVNKIRLTGGEPLIRKDIVSIVRGLRSLNGVESVSITTNGVTLSRHLESLVQAGLTGVNISLDTLEPKKFEFISRRRGHDRVLKALDETLSFPQLLVKLNCVVMRNLNDDELVPFVELTKERALDVRFIEYMPFDGNKWHSNKMVSYAEMVKCIQEKYPDFEREANLDQPNDTSKAWRVPHFNGRVGFISSMSEHFCDSCNRLRLTANGMLKVCLFGPNEVDLKRLMRDNVDEDDLINVVDAAVNRKKAKHAGMLNIQKTKNRPMILIGG